jgi:hypothetical protein
MKTKTDHIWDQKGTVAKYTCNGRWITKVNTLHIDSTFRDFCPDCGDIVLWPVQGKIKKEIEP